MADRTDKHQRSILPIPDRPHTGLITYDVGPAAADEDHIVTAQERNRIAMARQ